MRHGWLFAIVIVAFALIVAIRLGPQEPQIASADVLGSAESHVSVLSPNEQFDEAVNVRESERSAASAPTVATTGTIVAVDGKGRSIGNAQSGLLTGQLVLPNGSRVAFESTIVDGAWSLAEAGLESQSFLALRVEEVCLGGHRARTIEPTELRPEWESWRVRCEFPSYVLVSVVDARNGQHLDSVVVVDAEMEVHDWRRSVQSPPPLSTKQHPIHHAVMSPFHLAKPSASQSYFISADDYGWRRLSQTEWNDGDVNVPLEPAGALSVQLEAVSGLDGLVVDIGTSGSLLVSTTPSRGGSLTPGLPSIFDKVPAGNVSVTIARTHHGGLRDAIYRNDIPIERGRTTHLVLAARDLDTEVPLTTRVEVNSDDPSLLLDVVSVALSRLPDDGRIPVQLEASDAFRRSTESGANMSWEPIAIRRGLYAVDVRPLGLSWVREVDQQEGILSLNLPSRSDRLICFLDSRSSDPISPGWARITVQQAESQGALDTLSASTASLTSPGPAVLQSLASGTLLCEVMAPGYGIQMTRTELPEDVKVVHIQLEPRAAVRVDFAVSAQSVAPPEGWMDTIGLLGLDGEPIRPVGRSNRWTSIGGGARFVSSAVYLFDYEGPGTLACAPALAFEGTGTHRCELQLERGKESQFRLSLRDSGEK